MLILGDFNLNETMKYTNNYSHKAYYDELSQAFDPLGIIQLVDFVTWKRLVNGVWRSSILDHVYTDDVSNVSNLGPVDTIIGDHSLVMMSLEIERKADPVFTLKRDWSRYNKERLLDELSGLVEDWIIPDVQSNWNKIEEILIKVTDKVAPITEYM